MQQALMFFALFRKNPVVFTASSRSAIGAREKSAADLYFRNNSLVTILTRLSVHCAESIVAMSNWSGVENASSQCTSG